MSDMDIFFVGVIFIGIGVILGKLSK